jgi:hypothetical protein
MLKVYSKNTKNILNMGGEYEEDIVREWFRNRGIRRGNW